MRVASLRAPAALRRAAATTRCGAQPHRQLRRTLVRATYSLTCRRARAKSMPAYVALRFARGVTSKANPIRLHQVDESLLPADKSFASGPQDHAERTMRFQPKLGCDQSGLRVIS